MQRKPTPQSRGIRSAEKHHLDWGKERCICSACGAHGYVIAHHFAGSSAKVVVGFERVMIGHWAINFLCQKCDDIVTHQSRRAFRDIYGKECEVWLRQAEQYPKEIPLNVMQGIAQYGR
jgi:hypothetical protein